MNFKIKEVNDPHGHKFTAVLTGHDEFLFSGYGDDWSEAIGKCLISNRERLGITFEIEQADGTKSYSTVYGQQRVVEKEE